MIQEPFSKVNTSDLSTLPSTIPTSLNLGMVIDSDDGKVGIARVDSQLEFVKNYLSGNQLNPTDSDTVKHAFKMLQFMPIYVTRAMDNSVFGGITNNGDTIYTDTDFQVMKYYKQLAFRETEANYKSIMMKLKVSSASNSTATMFYMGDAPDYAGIVNGTIPKFPDASDDYKYIYDTVTEMYYTIASVNGNIATVDGDGSKEKPSGFGEFYFTYAFNVNFRKQFTIPSVSELYKLGVVVYDTDSRSYYTVTKVNSDDTLELNQVFNVNNGAVNLLNLIVGYNTNSFDGVNLSKFYTIGESGDQLIVTISNNTSMIELGYRMKESGPYTLVEIESTLESSKYKQITGNSSDQIGEDYLSINGFTYYSVSTSTSTSKIYPYIGVNFGENNINISRFFTYIYDYQVSNNTNINPASLETSVKVIFDNIDESRVELSGDFANKFIVKTVTDYDGNGTNGVELALLNNAKVSKGYVLLKDAVTVNGNTKDLIYYVGYDTNPVDGSVPSYFMFNDSGEYTIHSSGKLIYSIIDDLLNSSDYSDLNIEYTMQLTGNVDDSDSNVRLSYLSNELESFEKSIDKITKPSTAGSNYRYSFMNDAAILGSKTYSGLQLTIDDYLFYNVSYSTNNPDLTPVKLSSAPLTYMQFIRHLRRIVGNYFNSIDSSSDYGYGLTLMTNDPDEYSTIDWVEGNGIDMDEVISTNNAGIVTSAKFAIINKCPSKKKNLMFSLSQDPDDPELWNFIMTRKTDETSYTISFVKDKVDGYGKNVYYTYVNEMNPYIQLIELEGEDPVIKDTYTSNLFGNEVPIASPESDDFVNAVNRFKDNEGIYYDFIFDGGYANLVYAKGIFEVCKEIYAEGLLTMPQITDPDQLIAYRESSGIDASEGWRCVMRGNWIDDTTVADFLIKMSPMCAYVEKIVNNKTGMKEFAPIFGATNSAITYNPGFYIKKKSTREELLNHQIPVIIEDKSLGLRYWNLDTTLKVVDSSLCDANNCRMINACAHICNNQMKWYIGQFNTREVRTHVTESLTNLISNRLIKNQQYKLAGLKVICNESNNPVEVIEKRELIVDVAMQFTPGIRYIHVFQKVYKLSQDLNAL